MQRGQVAIESLILVLVIMSSTIYLGSLYYQTHNTTMAIGLARNTIVEQANSLEELIIVESIKFDPIINNMIITIKSETHSQADFNIEEIQNKIIKNTSFKEIQIEILSS